jgi:hypothetical protein
VEALLAFAATLLALRLGARLASRWAATRRPELAAWSAGLVAYAVAAGAMAAGAAGGWNEAFFRVYYLFGGLLTAVLLGLGSLLLVRARWALWPALVYFGLAIGVAVAVPIEGEIAGTAIPEAQKHLDLFPARMVAIVGNSLGTLAVVAVAAATFRRRPVGNVLIVTGIAVAAVGSAIAGLGAASTALFAAIAALLLYGGFTVRSLPRRKSTARVPT